ncbi:MAG: DUF6883 domain-containing protein [Allorhizobium sp.]
MSVDVKNQTLPVALLLNSDLVGSDLNYADHFRDALINALDTVGTAEKVTSRYLHGDLLLSNLAYKTSAVSNTGRTNSFRRSGDRELYATLIGDFLDAVSEQTPNLDYERLSDAIGRANIYCIVLPTMAATVREMVDLQLSSAEGYLGAVVLDLGNPLQTTPFVRDLFDDMFMEDNVLYSYRDRETENSSAGNLDGTTILAWDEFFARRPDFELPVEYSPRGLVSLARWEGKSAATVHERIANALAFGNEKVPFELDLASLPSSPTEVEIAVGKLTNYLLNPTHKDGGPKARFFSKELGIEQKNWRYLHAQFSEAIKRATFEKVRVEAHGIKVEADIAISGLNGCVAVVHTAWIIRKGERVSLVTALPGPVEHPDRQLATTSPVVDETLPDADRWERIYLLARRAGEIAAEKAVPTPMRIVGYPVIMEGSCGFGYVRVLDARKGFGRWLLRNAHASRGVKPGATLFFSSPTQSVDRAGAQAKGFAEVLRMNGIDCEHYTVLD